MKVTFCFPTHNYNKPMGGYKVVYEYANRLTTLGYEVNIVYCIKNSLKRYGFSEQIRTALAKTIVALSPKWFKLDKKIKCIAAEEILDDFIPDADIVFATAVETATPISKLSIAKGEKFYLIQGFENWVFDDKDVINTYHMGLNNITISKWLYDLLKENGAISYYIRNAIDTSIYKPIKPIETRNKHTIGFLYHKSENKGVKYVIEGLRRIKKQYPELEVYTFGLSKRPSTMPKWFHYTRKATQTQVVDIYNKCAIFLCATIDEGFGLTGLESMACGCTLVSSSYGAVFEYAKSEINSLLFPVRNVDAMCECLYRVIEDDKLRYNLARKGIETAKEYSWDNSIREMNMVLQEAVLKGEDNR